MKRLILSIAFIVAITALYAQNPGTSDVMRPNSNTISYTGKTADTTASTTPKRFDFLIGKDYLYYYEIDVKLDSAGDGKNVRVSVHGSNDDDVYYPLEDSVIWAVGRSDTVIRFYNYDTPYILTNASHTETMSAFVDTIRGTFTAYDSLGEGQGYSSGIGSYFVDDTLYSPGRTVTVAAQTTTKTSYAVGYRFLRVQLREHNATAQADLNKVTIVVFKKED